MLLRYALLITGLSLVWGCATPAASNVDTDLGPRQDGDTRAAAVDHHVLSFDRQRAGLGLDERDEADIRYALAGALMEEKAYPQARSHYAWLRQRHAAWWVAHLEYARATYFLDGNAEEALEALRSAILLKPVNPRAYLLMGQIHDDLGDAAKAELAYRQVLEWRPDEEKAAIQLARLRLRRGDPVEAATIYAKILEANDRNLQALLGLAALRESSGDQREAERLYWQCQKVHPDVVRGYAIVITYYKRQHQARKLAQAQRALDRKLERLNKGAGAKRRRR